MSENQPLLYSVDVAGRSFPVREIEGEERISALFRLDLRFVIPEGDPLSPDEVVRSAASVRLSRDDQVRSIEGIVTDVSVGAARRGAPEVRLCVEPRLALARYRSDVRVFRDKTAPEIVCEVLGAIGVSPELWLSRSYDRRPYCVQLRETDLDFVRRLLEDEGIFFFFQESGAMVLADAPSAYEPLTTGVIHFRAGSGLDRGDDAIVSMGSRASLTAGTVSLRDFNPEKPSLPMDVSADTGSPSGVEWYDFPGEYQDPGAGARKAQLHAEAFARAAAGYRGKSLSGRLRPGAKFTLALGPRGAPDGEYAVTAVRHAWSREKGGFMVDFEADHAEHAHRPPRVTPAPTLQNPVTGFVTGPPGEDIHCDAWGRVKVHFHWDRRLPPDGECSHWIPVLQDNTGQSAAIPRVGWEVLVHFLEGDPDRPVVLGRVYNGADPFPEALPQHKTRSALKSLSSPGRAGTNQIRFDDLAGAQEIKVFAERDQNVVVAHDKTERVELDELRSVGRDERVTIGNDTTEKIDGDHSVTVAGNMTTTVDGTQKVTVGGSSSDSIKGNRSLTVAGSVNQRLDDTDAVSADSLHEDVGAVILEAAFQSNSTSAGTAGTLTVVGAVAELALMDKSESATIGRVETIGAAVFSKSGKDTTLTMKNRRITTVGGLYSAHAKKKMTLGQKEQKADAKDPKKTGESTTADKVKAAAKVAADPSGAAKGAAADAVKGATKGAADGAAAKETKTLVTNATKGEFAGDKQIKLVVDKTVVTLGDGVLDIEAKNITFHATSKADLGANKLSTNNG